MPTLIPEDQINSLLELKYHMIMDSKNLADVLAHLHTLSENDESYPNLDSMLVKTQLWEAQYQLFRLSFAECQKIRAKPLSKPITKETYGERFKVASPLIALLNALKEAGEKHCGSQTAYLANINKHMNPIVSEEAFEQLFNTDMEMLLTTLETEYCRFFKGFKSDYLNTSWQEKASLEESEKALATLDTCRRAAEVTYETLATSLFKHRESIQERVAALQASKKQLPTEERPNNQQKADIKDARARESATPQPEVCSPLRKNTALLVNPIKSELPGLLKQIERPAFALGTGVALLSLTFTLAATLLNQAGLDALSINPAYSIAAILIGAIALSVLTLATVNHSRNHQWGLFYRNFKGLECTKTCKKTEKTTP